MAHKCPVGCCISNPAAAVAAVSALGCIPERTFRESRCNSSIYCSNNCYHLRTSTFLLTCRYLYTIYKVGKRRERERSKQSSYLHKRARRYSAAVLMHPESKCEKRSMILSLSLSLSLLRYVFVLRNCAIDHNGPYIKARA